MDDFFKTSTEVSGLLLILSRTVTPRMTDQLPLSLMYFSRNRNLFRTKFDSQDDEWPTYWNQVNELEGLGTKK